MSFDADPKWTSDIQFETSHAEGEESTAFVRCPYCGTSQTVEAIEAIEEYLKLSYYQAAHVPHYVELTCQNPACECDFKVHLGLTIRVRSVTE